jgi:hypothetical protein
MSNFFTLKVSIKTYLSLKRFFLFRVTFGFEAIFVFLEAIN